MTHQLNRFEFRAAAYRIVAMLCALFIVAGAAPAQGDPFSLTATPSSGAAVSASGSSLLDLSDNLIETKGQFASLTGQAFGANLRYGGLNNAFVYSQNSAGTSSTLSIPGIGFSRTFTGATPGDLQHNIRQFLENDGAAIYAQFLHEVNRSTYLGVADGNPLATTALLADLSYDEFGLQPTASQAIFSSDVARGQVASGLRLDFKGGYFDTRDGNGTYAQATLSDSFRLNDRLGLTFAALVNYRNEEGAQAYNLGGEIALPVLIIPVNGDRSLAWQVTPAFLAGGSGSVDLASGGLLLGGGITSSVSYRFDPFTVTLADHYSYFEGYPVRVGDYRFDTDINQQILKNGAKVTYSLSRGLALDVGCSYTDLLNSAKVGGYYSPEAGIVFRIGPRGGLRAGYQGNFASGFHESSGVIQLFFGY